MQRLLLDVLDDVEVDNLPLILSVANLCNKSCMHLLERCLEMVVRSNLDMITLEKALPSDIIEQITDSRLSLGLVSPEDKGFPNKHVRRILRALDSDDVCLVGGDVLVNYEGVCSDLVTLKMMCRLSLS